MNKTIFFLAAVVMLYSCNNHPSDPAKGNPTPADSVSETDTIQIKHIQIGSEGSGDKNRFYASYPKTPFDFVNQAEEKFTQQFLKDFHQTAEATGTESAAGVEFGQHFELTGRNNDIMAFLYERFTSYGNNYYQVFFSRIYDLKKKKLITASDIFYPKANFEKLAVLAKSIVESQLYAKINAMPGHTEADRTKLYESLKSQIENGTKAIDGNYHAFSFDKEGRLKIYFDKYQVASGNFGSMEVVIPPQQYTTLVLPLYRDLFKLKAIESEEELAEGEGLKPAADTTKPLVNCGEEPCVALTFDDGPSIYTTQLLDILKENDAKATFFVLGKSAKVQKNTIQRMAKEGHQIGNHSWDHKDLKKLSEAQIRHQIFDTDSVIEEITGERPKVLRPPYGSFNKKVADIAEKPLILWNLDPMDWKDKNTALVTTRMSQAHQNGIVLAHDIHKTTVDAIPQVIKALKEKGFHLVTIDELLAGQPIANGKVYRSR